MIQNALVRYGNIVNMKKLIQLFSHMKLSRNLVLRKPPENPVVSTLFGGATLLPGVVGDDGAYRIPCGVLALLPFTVDEGVDAASRSEALRLK